MAQAHFDGNAGTTRQYHIEGCRKAMAILQGCEGSVPKYAAQALSQALNSIKQFEAIITYPPHTVDMTPPEIVAHYIDSAAYMKILDEQSGKR